MTQRLKGILTGLLAAVLVLSSVGNVTISVQAADSSELEEALQAVEEAQAVIDRGSWGFFESVGADEALTVLNGSYLTDYAAMTEIGEAGDATSLENMRYAILMLAVGNELRAQDDNFTDNQYPLMVTDELMAISQVQTNFSAYTEDHSHVYSVGENLAWGYDYTDLTSASGSSGPYDGWYYEEKNYYDNNLDGNTGHYINLMNSYTLTGGAINQYGDAGSTQGQVFKKGSTVGAYTVADYLERFDEYYHQVKQNLEDANSAYALVAASLGVEAETTPSEALAEAKEALAQGSLGFFEYVGATDALSVFENEGLIGYEKYIDYGGENDATGLENMRYAILMIGVGNELRAQDDNFTDNQDPLLISDRLMAISQVQTDISSYIEMHSQIFWVGENLAWGYGYKNLSSEEGSSGPYNGWYYEEKGYYDNDVNQNTGHYENLMGSYTTTGGAVNQKGNYRDTEGQVFNYGTGSGLYTVDDYLTRFDQYYNKVMQDLEDAETAAVTFAKVSGVSLDKTQAMMNKGENLTLTATVAPSTARDVRVVWESSDESVATVSAEGVVSGVGSGTAVITVTTRDGEKTATCTVTVTVPVTDIQLSNSSLYLEKGKTSTLTATVKPDDATNPKVTWTSSDASVATVSEDGTVTAVSGGRAVITVAAMDGSGVTATCNVNVTVPAESISFKNENLTVGGGKTKATQVVFTPSDSSNQNVTFSVSDEEYATVDSEGTLTGVKVKKGEGSEPGSVTLNAVSEDGNHWATAQVTVLFNDVMKDSTYYYSPVYWAYNQGITTGRSGGQWFDPSATCTRAEIVTFLWRLAGKPEPTIKNPFEDISKGKYYYKAVLWAYEKGITTGRRGGETFDPNATCTRREIVTFLWRYAGKPEPASMESKFKDIKDSSAYYYQAVLWAVEKGITTGKAATHYKTFDPLGECTRGMSVTFIFRYAAD